MKKMLIHMISWKVLEVSSCNEQVSLEHSGALRDALEKLW